MFCEAVPRAFHHAILLSLYLALVAGWFASLGLSQSQAADDFFLRDGQRVLFFGDSITQGGGYVQLIDAFLATRLPAQTFEIVNHGISSETISGTSEIDHTPRRPDAHKRFARDVPRGSPTCSWPVSA